MPFHRTGFRTIGPMGQPSATSGAGSTRATHTYVTNDDRAALETGGYFNALLDPVQVKTGDLLEVSFDNDGTPGRRGYVIKVVAGVVVLTSEGDAAGLGLFILPQFINLADITAAGDLLSNYTPGFNGRIEKVDFVVQKPVTTAAKALSLNWEIGAVNLTGGVVALTSANCTPQGALVAGSAVTAANSFGPTDTISLEASAVTAFLEGSGWLLTKFRNLDT